MGFYEWSNSGKLFLLCSIAIVFIMFQSVVFIRRAWQEGLKEGFLVGDLKQMVSTSILSAILPTVSAILFLIMLSPMVGRYFAWLRLSVLGSGSYEYMAADITLKTLGFQTLLEPGVTMSVYITVMWAMSLGISSAPLMNVFVFQSFYEKLQSMSEKPSGFGRYVGPCLMVTMMAVLLMPKVMDYKNPLSMMTAIFTSILVLLLNKVGEKKKFAWFKDFSFPISMLTGVVFAIVLGNTIFLTT